MQWLEDEFLPFLDAWEKSVEEREGFTDAEKNRMKLSTETLLGLRITGEYEICMYIQYMQYMYGVCGYEWHHCHYTIYLLFLQ